MKVPILHLENGVHQFEGIVNAASLQFPRKEIYPNDIQVKVELNKFGKNITCLVNYNTISHYSCDRCLLEFNKNIEGNFNVLFHLGEGDFETDEEDVIFLSPEQVDIDLSPNIQENLILSIPMKILCKEECKGICPGCGIDLNNANCVCEKESVDPRWDNLKKLLK